MNSFSLETSSDQNMDGLAGQLLAFCVRATSWYRAKIAFTLLRASIRVLCFGNVRLLVGGLPWTLPAELPTDMSIKVYLGK